MIEIEKRKAFVLIQYLKTILPDKYKIWAEYSTNKDDVLAIVVQEQTGPKTVLYNGTKINNYYSIDIFDLSIKSAKETAILIGSLIGENVLIDLDSDDGTKSEKWQILFKQYTNPQTLEYADIRRVSYNATLQCIISKVYEVNK